jgi:D-glycero-D-manno-heptose 1,7-bisphosphate phosphatase
VKHLPAAYRPVDFFGFSAEHRRLTKDELVDGSLGYDRAELMTLYYAQTMYCRDGSPLDVPYQHVISGKVHEGEPLTTIEADWIAAQIVRLAREAFMRKASAIDEAFAVGWFLRWQGAGALARIAPWRAELCAQTEVDVFNAAKAHARVRRARACIEAARRPTMHKRYKLIAFDADGTIRRCTVPGQPCPNKPDEWVLMPGVREVLATVDWTETHFGIASNQGGVALGFLSQDMAMDLLESMAYEALRESNANSLLERRGILICPHAPQAVCSCRKPAPQMLHDLMRTFAVAPKDVLYVGDQESDRETAERAGVDFQWAKVFFGWRESDPLFVPQENQQR